METEFAGYESSRPERKMRERRAGEVLAKIGSVLLHPFAMPVYGAFTLLFGPTYISILPNNLKWYILAVFALTTLFLPVFAIGLLHNLKVLPDISLMSRRQRTLPILIVVVSYLFCNYFVRTHIAVDLLSHLLIGAVSVILLCFIVNFFWKISLHMAAIGGLVGMLFYVTLKGYGDLTSLLLLFMVLSGMLGTARLYLGRHNIWQVLAGFLAGAGMIFLTMSIL